MSKPLSHKVALVTGGSRGIGAAIARRLAHDGADVAISYSASADRAESLVQELKDLGVRAAAFQADQADPLQVEALVNNTARRFGKLDILVNNAGILRDRMLVNMEEHEWDAVLEVHLKGHFAPTRHAAAHWRERSKAGEDVRARIINTSSPSGVFGNVGQLNYGAAKAGIVGFTLIAAQELQRYGVTVNAIAPNARTRMTEAAFGEIPPPDDGFDPADPANNSPIVVALCTDEAQGITGQVFFVYGGVVNMLRGWEAGELFANETRWEPDALLHELQQRLPDGAAPPGMLESMHRAGGESMRER
jgi:NAD(P)-dependent dehydrogenase (short-subunit alcohol dehydrogenase family)